MSVTTQKPNIIFVLADQLCYQDCGYNGNGKARTPNVDRFAQEGVNFNQAVSSMPVCSAYRASLFTGKYTTSTGMVINELRINPEHHPQPLARCLTNAGYETGYIGKWHLYANEMGGHFEPKNSFVPRGPHRLGFDGYWAAYNFHHSYYGENSYYHTESPEKIHYGDGVFEPDAQTDQAISFINTNKEGKKPFMLMVSYGTPHDPWHLENVPPEYYKLFKDVEFPPPPNFSEKTDPYGDEWEQGNKSPELIQNWKRSEFAMMANLDWNFGRLLEAVKQADIQDNTIIVFASDHGCMLGSHGRLRKNIFYEESVRVPFLVRWPGQIPAGLVSDSCLDVVDIMPTLLGLAEVSIPDEVEGMNLSHQALNKSGPEPEFALLMNTGPCAIWENGYEWRGARTSRYTYARYRIDGKEFLFDNQNDPCQLVNLAGDLAHQGLKESLRKKMETKMASINDSFQETTWYRDHWTEDRIIVGTAKNIPKISKVKHTVPDTIASHSKVSASFSDSKNPPEAINNGMVPKNSGDYDVPRFTWYPHKGSVEWVQYDFDRSCNVSQVQLYWFNDFEIGEKCRLPESWRLLYQDNGVWKTVLAMGPYGLDMDNFITLNFKPVTTNALRIEVQLHPKHSAGILQWKVS